MEDREIVELYWQRSQSAIPETETKYGTYCRSISKNICGNYEDAEECVNDTYFKAWNLMPDKRPALLSVFLGGIVRNISIDRFRTNTRKKRGGGEMPAAIEELAECISSPQNVEREVEDAELKRELRRFVNTLKKDEQTVFICRYYYLAPISRIAEKTGFSQSKIKSMLSRIRSRLRVFLKEEGLC